MNPRLVGIAGPWKDAIFFLSAGEVSIGRESSNQFWIADPALSRRHCMLTRKSDHFTIRDLKSHNGTLINGVPIEEQELRHGDQISVGDSVLVFLLEEDEFHLQTNPIEFAETVELQGVRFMRRPEETLYREPDKVMEGLSETTRLTRDLNALLKIATGIGGIRDRESLEWQLLGFIFDVVPAECGAVLVFDHSGEFNSAVAWDRVRGPGHPVRVSRSLVKQVVRDCVGVLASDVAGNQALGEFATLSELRVRSLLCVPLLVSGKALGAIYLDSRSPTEHFDENHLQVMTAVAGIASLALDNVRHLEHLRQENQNLRAEINLEHNMVGGSVRMRDVFEVIRRAAPTDSTVLLLGESGTGKELVARAIHRNSPRADRPFVAINCAAIPETLLEAELFGHEKGAFSGASAQRKGKVEVAERGTLFLDEISELALGLQAKLLRVLQEREFERVGGTLPIKLDIRVIAATNRNLSEAVRAGAFREDLYYRLNVISLTLPALRERREDIPFLADHLIAKASRKCKTRIKPVSAEAMTCLMGYDWPGNVRELENALERALVLGSTDTVLPDDLPETILEAGLPAAISNAKYCNAVKDKKKQLVLRAFQQANGNYLEAAKSLGMHPNSLLRLIRNLQLRTALKAPSAPPGAA
jgi:Nif-specific regulatory protein